MRFWVLRETIKDNLVKFFLWCITKLCTSKDEALSQKLHDLAGTYQRRPQEGWKAPDDWDCWRDQ